MLGTFNELMSKMDFSDLIGQHVDLNIEEEDKPAEEEVKQEKEEEKVQAESSGANQRSAEEIKKDDDAAMSKGKLITKETQKAGQVTGETYKQYITSGGTLVAIVVLLFHILSQGTNILSFWWLTYWTGHPEKGDLNIGIYALLVGYVILYFVLKLHGDTNCIIRSVFLFCTIREIMYQTFTLRASTNIHNLMFRTILRAPMAFFDSTPLGRILNRFAVDMDTIDYLLPDMSMQGLHNGFQVLGVLVLISVFLHYMPLLYIL